MMYSAYKLNKQGGNIQPWCTSFPIWNQSAVPRLVNCCFLTCIQISQEAGKVVWYSHLLKTFPQFVVIHTVKGFGIVNKAEVDIFLELSCFFSDPTDVGNVISVSSPSLNIWKFTVHVLLKPGLENFEHYFASMWDEWNCVLVWTFFGIPFLWDINHVQFSSVQSLSHFWLFATPWIAARQASLSITNSWSLPKLVHWVGDAIQPSHPLSSSSPPAPNPSQHQSLFQWVSSLHEVAKVLEFQL